MESKSLFEIDKLSLSEFSQFSGKVISFWLYYSIIMGLVSQIVASRMKLDKATR